MCRCEKLGDRGDSQIAIAPAAQADGVLLGLLGTDDCQHRDLHLFAGADQFAEPVAAAVDGGANTSLGELIEQLFRVGLDLVGDRQQAHLFRGQPEGVIAGVVLGHDPEETLQRTEDGAVDHDRPLLAAVGGDVVELEAFRQVEIQLDGGALPHPSDRVFNLQVDLGSVEGAAALINLVGPALALQGFDQSFGGQIPDGVISDGFLRTGGEVDLVIAEVEGGEDPLGEIQDLQESRR